MVLLDEKGRLFRKINIVDFSIILLFLIVIPALFYVYEVLGKRPTTVPMTWIKVEVVTFTLPEIAELFKPGDISYDELWKPNGKILQILKKDIKYGERFKKAKIDKNATSYEYKIPVFLELELLCSRAARDEHWFYRRAQLNLGLDANFHFETNKYSIYCHIIRI